VGHKLLKFIDFIPTLALSLLLLFSLFYQEGNKFDTTGRLFFPLFCGYLALALLGFAVMRGLWLKKEREVLNCQKNFIQNLFLLGFLVFVLISFVKSQTFNFGFTEVLMSFSSVLIYFLLQTKSLNFKFLYRLAIFLLSLAAICGYVLYFTSNHNRDFGLFYNPAIKAAAWPNAFALFVLMLWPITLHWFLGKSVNSRLIKFLKYFLLALVLASFVLTFSRAAILAMLGQIVIFAVYGIYYYKNLLTFKQIFKKIWLVLPVFILIFILIGAAQFGRAYYQNKVITFKDRLEFSNGEKITSVQERKDFWLGAIQLIKKEPIFGYGPMSFGYVYRSIQKDWLAISDHPHNVFLKIAVENGLPASIFFGLFLLAVIIRFIRNFLRFDKQKQFLLVTLAVAIMGAIAHSLVDCNFNFATNLIIFWMILGIFNALIVENLEIKFAKGHLCNYLIVGLVFLIVFYLTVFETFNAADGYLARKYLKEGHTNEANKLLIYFGDHTLYSRYFFLDEADRYLRAGDLESAEQMYLKYAEANKWDAMIWNRLGEFYRDYYKDNVKATEYFQQAITLDGKNFWVYYLNYARALTVIQARLELQHLGDLLLKEFQQYLPKVEGNLHYTANTGNPSDALSLLNILAKYDSVNIKEYTNFRNRIKKALVWGK